MDSLAADPNATSDQNKLAEMMKENHEMRTEVMEIQHSFLEKENQMIQEINLLAQ